MAVQDSALNRFTQFMAQHEARLRESLMATCGGESGREAAAVELMFAWDNLDRLEAMEEPLSYLYTRGLNCAPDGRSNSTPTFDPVEAAFIPEVDPDLPRFLRGLPEQERVPLVLIGGFQWTQAEAGTLLGLGAATVQGYVDRGMERLRQQLRDAPSSPIERQLADYGFRQRQLHGSLSAGEVLERFRRADAQAAIGSTQAGTQLRSRTLPPRSLRIAAATAVLLVFGGVAFALRTIGTDPSESGQFDVLKRVQHNEIAFDQPFDLEISSLAVGGPGFVAVGSYGSASQQSVAAVWTSVDTVTWSRVPHDEDVFGAGDAFTDGLSMRSITPGGPGFVATGRGETWGETPDDPYAAVWTSVDGLAWSRVDHQAQFDSADMSAVTALGQRLTAVGYRVTRDDDDGYVTEAAVWTSTDGVNWSRVAADGAFDDAEMSGVTGGDQGLVAVGSDSDGNAAVWISSSGTAWTRVPHDEGVFGTADMSGVTSGGPGFIAVGHSVVGETDYHYVTEAAVWISSDGVTWSRISAGGIFDDARMSRVSATPAGVAAVGSVVRGFGRYAAVWLSDDGMTWEKEPVLDTSSDPSEMLGITAATVSRFAPGYGPGGSNVRAFITVGSAGSDAAAWVIHPVWEECRRRLGESARERLGCLP